MAKQTVKPQRPGTQPEINEFRRARLMESTIRLLAEKGVAGATVRAITGDAEVSHGLIGHYYATMDELLVAALEHLFAGVATDVAGQIAAAGEDPIARLRALPEALFSAAIFTETNRSAFLAFWHEIRFNEAVQRANQALYDGYRERVCGFFSEAAAYLGQEIDCESAAIGLIALSDGLWLELSISAGEVDADRAAELCHGFIDTQLKR